MPVGVLPADVAQVLACEEGWIFLVEDLALPITQDLAHDGGGAFTFVYVVIVLLGVRIGHGVIIFL
jgi:hypothetical protein